MRLGTDDDLGRVEYLGCLSHERDSAENDDFRICFGCLDGQPEGISYEVSYILNFGQTVVVHEYYGVALLLEFLDAGNLVHILAN